MKQNKLSWWVIVFLASWFTLVLVSFGLAASDLLQSSSLEQRVERLEMKVVNLECPGIGKESPTGAGCLYSRNESNKEIKLK